jgi:AcrR family transcriptional regulator
MTTARRERLKYELREQILAAARDLFAREGYLSVSIRKIADAVGCAPGTIYLHFENKDSILAAICIETFAKLDKRMEAIAHDTGDPLESLRRSGRVYVQFALDHPFHYLVTFGEAVRSGAMNEEAHQAGMHCFACLTECVGRCARARLLRFDDVAAVAQSMWATIHGLSMLLITKEGFPFIEKQRLIDTLLDIAIEGVRKR